MHHHWIKKVIGTKKKFNRNFWWWYYSWFRASLHFPRSVEGVKNLSNTLQHYRDDHLAYLLLLYCSAYLYKQSFSLPGSAILVDWFISDWIFNCLFFLFDRIFLVVLYLGHGLVFPFVVYWQHQVPYYVIYLFRILHGI